MSKSFIYQGVPTWSGFIVHWEVGSNHTFKEQSPALKIEGRTPLAVRLAFEEAFVLAAIETEDGSLHYVALNRIKTVAEVES